MSSTRQELADRTNKVSATKPANDGNIPGKRRPRPLVGPSSSLPSSTLKATNCGQNNFGLLQKKPLPQRLQVQRQQRSTLPDCKQKQTLRHRDAESSIRNPQLQHPDHLVSENGSWSFTDAENNESSAGMPTFVKVFGEKLGQEGAIGVVENELLKMCFDSAIVCGAAGLSGKAFDESACEILDRSTTCNDADATGQLLQYCLQVCAESERTSEQQAAQLFKLAHMHERYLRRAEIARMKTVIDALWFGHQDDLSVDMEVELFRFLKHKHGTDKARMAAEAGELVSSMSRLAKYDADIAVFFDILRNEIDQGFWKVRTKLQETVRELATQGMSPREIIAHMYNDADAADLLRRLDEEEDPALQDVLLRFHLERHTKLIAPIRDTYATLDLEERAQVSFSSYVRAALLPPSSPP